MIGERVVRIFASELAVIADEASRWPATETGGELLGLWSHGDSPTVFLATRPGPGAEHDVARFQQSPGVHALVERLAWERSGLQVVGLWHSHHQLRLHHLSEGDIGRTMSYASTANRRRFTDVLAWLTSGEVGVRPWVWTDGCRGAAAPTRFEVLPGESPIRAGLRGWLESAPRWLAGVVAPANAPMPRLHTSTGISARRAPPSAVVDDGGLEALAHVIALAIPEDLQEHVELKLPRDGDAVVRVPGPRGRALRLWVQTRPDLRVRRWEIVDALSARTAAARTCVEGESAASAVAAGVRALLMEAR